jgi:hypothetical protein
MPSPSARVAKSNRLLSALPRETLDELLPDLELMDLPVPRMLQQAGQKLDEVVFPLTAIASMFSMGASVGPPVPAIS